MVTTALVFGEVQHERRETLRHKLAFRTSLWLIDLRKPMPSGPLLRFPADEHFDGKGPDIATMLVNFAVAQGGTLEDSDQLLMLSAPHRLGYAFNPLSVFWCVTKEGQIRWRVLEIHNTYGERHAHLLPGNDKVKLTKEFYVSPFFPVDGEYEVTTSLDDHRVGASVNLYRDKQLALSASFFGSPVAPTYLNRVRAALRSPFAGYQTSVRIKAHGIWLWLRKLPVYPRPVHRAPWQRKDAQSDWPDIANLRPAPVRAWFARRLLGRVARVFPVSFKLPSGKVVGKAPARIDIHRDAFFHRLGRSLKIGLGEAYMAGDWSVAQGQDLAEVLSPIAERLDQLVPNWAKWLRHVLESRQPQHERNSRRGAKSNIARHYDLSNELFALFLDPTMTYSSAWFDGRAPILANLEGAQWHKVEGVLDFAGVQEGTQLLEIGTGWGQLALQSGQRKAQVLSITLSQQQLELARKRISAAGLNANVEVEYLDYRDVIGTYDAVASVEMIEAVGEEFWPDYFNAVSQRLRVGGLFGLQAITMQHDRMVAARRSYSWIHKYIFPGGLIPSVEAINQHANAAGLKIVRQRNFGLDYASTLRLWRERFLANDAKVKTLGFDSIFIKMWEYYLAYSEAGFRSGHLDVYQFSMVKS